MSVAPALDMPVVKGVQASWLRHTRPVALLPHSPEQQSESFVHALPSIVHTGELISGATAISGAIPRSDPPDAMFMSAGGAGPVPASGSGGTEPRSTRPGGAGSPDGLLQPTTSDSTPSTSRDPTRMSMARSTPLYMAST